MATRVIPKGCTVHSIRLGEKGAEVRYHCADDRGQKEYRSADGSISNYPSTFVRKVQTVRLGAASVGGRGATVHAFMTCMKDRQDLVCKPTTSGDFGRYRR